MSKSKFVVVLSLLLGGFVLLAAEQRLGLQKEIQIKPRRTHEEIAKRQKPMSAPEERRQVRHEDVVKGKQRAVHRKERGSKGLIDRSLIVSSPYDWTLLPKKSVLNVPPLYQKRINGERHGKLIGWQEFYAKNRAWIRLLPVTIEQAQGDKPLTPEYLESLKKTGLLVVAVCKGGPISVKLPEQESGEAVKIAGNGQPGARGGDGTVVNPGVSNQATKGEPGLRAPVTP